MRSLRTIAVLESDSWLDNCRLKGHAMDVLGILHLPLPAFILQHPSPSSTRSPQKTGNQYLESRLQGTPRPVSAASIHPPSGIKDIRRGYFFNAASLHSEEQEQFLMGVLRAPGVLAAGESNARGLLYTDARSGGCLSDRNPNLRRDRDDGSCTCTWHSHFKF